MITEEVADAEAEDAAVVVAEAVAATGVTAAAMVAVVMTGVGLIAVMTGAITNAHITKVLPSVFPGLTQRRASAPTRIAGSTIAACLAAVTTQQPAAPDGMPPTPSPPALGGRRAAARASVRRGHKRERAPGCLLPHGGVWRSYSGGDRVVRHRPEAIEN